MRYVYLLKDPISKEVVWVGETSNPKQRYNSHCWGTYYDPKDKSLWLSGLKALGLKPIFEIVDILETKIDALKKENEIIVMLLKKGVKLFNINNTRTIKQYSINGTLIAEFYSQRAAKEITGIRPRIERLTSGNYQWSYGEFNSESTTYKEDIKKIKCKPVLQIDKSGNIISEFDGVRIACKKTGIDHRSISQVASGSEIRKTAGGYYWKYKN